MEYYQVSRKVYVVVEQLWYLLVQQKKELAVLYMVFLGGRFKNYANQFVHFFVLNPNSKLPISIGKPQLSTQFFSSKGEKVITRLIIRIYHFKNFQKKPTNVISSFNS